MREKKRKRAPLPPNITSITSFNSLKALVKYNIERIAAEFAKIILKIETINNFLAWTKKIQTLRSPIK